MDVQDIYPLSPMQRLFWIAAARDPRMSLAQFRYRIDGVLDPRRFEAAWRSVASTHDTLRTAIVSEGLDEPLQVVLKDAQLEFAVTDLSVFEPVDQQARIDAHLAADRDRGMPLDRAPLIRFALFHLNASSWEFVWTLYRGLLDGWSVDVLWRQVWFAYDTLDSAAPVTPAARFRDYIEWLQKRDAAAAERFWRQALHGASVQSFPHAALDTCTASAASGLAHERQAMSRSLTNALRAVAREHHVTLGSVVLTSWAVALAATIDESDVLVGTTVSGRPAQIPGADAIVGQFINNLPVRLRVDRSATLSEVCQRLQLQQLDSQSYEYASPDQIQRWASMPANDRLFDTLVVFQGLDSAASANASRSATLQVTDVTRPLPANYAVSVMCVPGQTLDFWVTFDPARASADALRTVIANLRSVLELIAVSPDASLGYVLDRLARFHADGPRLAPPPPVRERSLPISAAPRTATEDKLLAIWQRLLRVSPIGIGDDFFALGGNSLLAVTLFDEIRHTFGTRLPLGALFKGATIENLASLIGLTAEGADPAAFVVQIRAGKDRLPLFLTHGIGGEILSYAPLAANMAGDQPVFGIQGLESDSLASYSTLEARMARYVDAIKRVAPTGPYFLAGHCAGALVTLEIAQQLWRRGEEVGLVGLIDYWLGEQHRDGGSAWQTTLDATRNLPLWISDDLMPSGVREISGRIQSKTRAVVSRTAQHLFRGATKTSPDVRDVLGMWHYPDASVPLLEADFKMFSEYRPKAYAGRVMVIRPRALPLLERRPLDDLGWTAVAEGGVDVHVVPGSHSTIMKEPLVRHLADVIQRAIDQYTAADPQRRQESAAS